MMGATTKATALFCPRCAYVPATVPDLVEHLVAEHQMSDEDATHRAVDIVGEVDPVVPPPERLHRKPLVDRLLAPPPRPCHYCHRANGTHTPKCRVATRRALCGHCKTVLPKHTPTCPKREGCRNCAQVAPAKCARHGGRKLTTSEYKWRKKLAAGNEAPWSTTLAKIAADIGATRQRLVKLEAARAALLALR